MAHLRRGIKAGVVAGIIASLVFGVIFTLLNVVFFYDNIVAAVDAILVEMPGELLPDEEVSVNREAIIVFSVYGRLLDPLIYLLPSLLIGLLFAGLFSRIPGGTVLQKGLAVGVLLWFLGVLGSLLTTYDYSSPYLYFNHLLSLANQLFFGYLLAHFWTKFEK